MIVDALDTAVVVIVIAIVITKALDVLTTLRAVGVRGEGETNVFAQRWMRRFGVGVVAAVVFAVTVAVALVVGVGAIRSDVVVVKVGCVVVGGFVAFVQGAVAHTNASGRWNFVTRRVLAFHRWFGARGIRTGGDADVR